MCTSLMMGEEDMYRSVLLRLLVAAEDRRLALDAHEDREDRGRDDDVAHSVAQRHRRGRAEAALLAPTLRGTTPPDDEDRRGSMRRSTTTKPETRARRP